MVPFFYLNLLCVLCGSVAVFFKKNELFLLQVV